MTVTVGPPNTGSPNPLPTPEEAAGQGCGSGFRWWLLPIAFFGAIATVAVVFVVLAALGAVPAPPFAGSAPPYWILFPLGFFGFWLLFFALVRPWRRWGGPRWGAWAVTNAEEIVRIRFARGEISREEMDRLLRDLAASAP